MRSPHSPRSTKAAAAAEAVRRRVESLAEPMAEHNVSSVDLETRAFLGQRAALAILVVIAVLGGIGLGTTVFAGGGGGADYPLPAGMNDAAPTGQSGATSGREGSGAAGGRDSTGDSGAAGDTGGKHNAKGTNEQDTSSVVSVQGMVAQPGLIRTPPETRLGEVLDLAGGLLPGARVHQLNLAEAVSDGMQVSVDEHGSEVRYSGEGAGGSGGAGGLGGGGGAAGVGREGTGGGAGAQAGVNINTADAAALETLPGIGPATAQAIIAHRSANGPFASPEQLMEVRGIGPAKFEAMKDAITL